MQFYVKRGWHKLPSTHAVITLPTAGKPPPKAWTARPKTRLLSSEEIPALCVHDVEEIKTSLENLPAKPHEIVLVVLPTLDVVTCMHDRGYFMARKRIGEGTEFHGAISEDGSSWMY